GDVARAGADTHCADPRRVDGLVGGEEVDRAQEVLDLPRRRLVLPRLAAALAEVAVVEGEGDKTAVGEGARVVALGLLLHRGQRAVDDDGVAAAAALGDEE